MAGTHGRKKYYQLLLDPHRAALLNELADEKGKRATALVRDFVYAMLERELPASVYRQAESADDAVWRESVRNRVEGRTKSRKESVTADS